MTTVTAEKQTSRILAPGASVTVEALTSTEKHTLAECEKVIQHHFDTFREAGEALFRIRDSRLYREGYATFEVYCRMKWGLSKTQANRLIAASQTVQNLEKVSATVAAITKQLTETSVRPLTKLAPKVQRKVLEKVAKRLPPGASRAGGVSAKVILDTAREIAPEAFHRGGAPPTPNGGGKQKPFEKETVLAALDKWHKDKANSGELDNMTASDAFKQIRRLVERL